MTDLEIIQALAGGARIVTNDEGGYDGYSYELITSRHNIEHEQILRLLDGNYIRSSNTVYLLTDEGKKVYLKSIDELTKDIMNICISCGAIFSKCITECEQCTERKT